jgi:hypothetical protein
MPTAYHGENDGEGGVDRPAIMRTMNSKLVPIAMVLAMAAPISAQTSEQQMLRRHFDRNLEAVGREARQSLPGLLLYPQDVREAILTISQTPELVVLAPRLDEAERAEYPEDVQAAVAVLDDHEEILDVLASNLVATGVVGRLYDENAEFIRRTVNRMAEQAIELQQSDVDDWVERLESDQEAMDELHEAAKAYAEENGFEIPVYEERSDIPDDDWWYETYGYWWWGSTIVIGDRPCGRFIRWLLEHCDKWDGIVDRIIDHIRDRERPAHLPGELEDAFQRWQDRNPRTTMQGFLNDDGQRRERLRELGTAIRESGDGRVSDFVRNNPDRFPNLSRPAGPDGGRVERPARDIGRQPSRTPSRNFQRHSPTRQQQMRRAVSRHRTAWRPRGGGFRGGGRGGGRGGRR